MRAVVINKTTNEGKVFNIDKEASRFNNFCRKAVLDFVSSCGSSTVTIGEGKYLTYDEDTSEEPIFWLVVSILYMKCRESGEWGDILDIYEVNEEEDE